MEQLAHILLLDAVSRIGYRRVNYDCFIIGEFNVYRKADMPLLGKFYRVIKEIDKYLLDPDVIAVKFSGKPVIDIHCEFDIAPVDPRVDDIGEVVQRGARLVRYLYDIHFPRFDFGEVENIVDDNEKVFARILYLVNILSRFRRHILAERHLRHSEDRVHRRAYLVAHIREEAGLGAVGFFRLIQCRLKLLIVLFTLRVSFRLDLIQLSVIEEDPDRYQENRDQNDYDLNSDRFPDCDRFPKQRFFLDCAYEIIIALVHGSYVDQLVLAV